MSRVRRSVLTVGAGFGGSVVVTLTGFIATPFLLRYLGPERFGIFRAANDWFGYVGLLEFGVGGALMAVFSKALGTDDRPGLAAGLRAGMRAYLIVALLMLVSAASLAAAMPWLIRAPEALAGEVRLGCGVYLLVYAMLPLAVLRPLAEAEQRGYVVHLVNTAQMLTAMGLSLVLAAAGWGLVGQFLGLVAGSVVFHSLLAWDGLRRHPEAIRGRAAGHPELWSLSWPTLVFNLSGRLSLLSDNILLAAILGPAAVTPFILTQRLIQAASVQVTGIGAAGWAGLVDLYYRGERALFERRFAQLTRLTAIVGVALLVPNAVWNRDLIVLWVGPAQYAGAVVTWLAVGCAWGQGMVALWLWPLMAAGRVRALMPMLTTGAAFNLGASALGTAIFGIPGPLIGTAATLAGMSWWWLMLHIRREFGVAPAVLLKAAAGPVLVAAPYTIALVLLAEATQPYDPAWPKWAKWAALAGWLGGSCGGYLALAWAFALPKADRAEWSGRFLAWLRRGAARPADPVEVGR